MIGEIVASLTPAPDVKIPQLLNATNHWTLPGHVSVGIGTPTQAIDLLPGGSWTANILSTSICFNSSDCPSLNAGLFDMHTSTSYTQINNTGVIANTTFTNQAGALPALTGAAHVGLDTLTISNGTDSNTIENFELLVIENANQTLSNGTTYAPQVGTLALGAPNINQTFSSNLTGQFLSSGLYSQAKIPSNSFGLHVGSASMGIHGSLVLGGYDQSRVLTPVTTQEGYNGTAFFLAQAPGPDVPDEKLVNFQPDSTSLDASTTVWKETWSSHWTPLTTPLDLSSSSSSSSQSPVPSSSSSSSNTGLPTAQMICKRKANMVRANKEEEKEEAILREMEKKRERQGIDLGWIKLEDDP
ncbi:hypothetical protein BOTCAL_0597g00060 [Botryotinia calthae]|uniref:Peptidase A1 domain-containing protein n=1 Tax=Botryotinia calthae TaxID=38488 RepID=A0A4Y8CJR5_9HELO|nr:hypothetical protein BOTCAL_0597g00060 [Botryotinia calthae]